jgi:hypothetical protein
VILKKQKLDCADRNNVKTEREKLVYAERNKVIYKKYKLDCAERKAGIINKKYWLVQRGRKW